MKTRKNVVISLAALLLIASSCATTKLTTAWKDETYLYLPARKLFVVGAFSDDGVRRLFEKAVVLKLTEQGTEAVASHSVFSAERIPDHEALLLLMREQQCDFVMVTHFQGEKRTGAPETGKKSAAAPRDFAALWREYYRAGFTRMPARSQQRELYRVETDLYETGDERPIWKSGAELSVNGPVADQHERLVELLVRKLQTDKIIPDLTPKQGKPGRAPGKT